MSRADEATYVRGPKAGAVYKNVCGTTHKVYATPSAWLGQKVIIKAQSGDVFINWGSANTVEVSRTAESTWNSTTKALTVSSTTGDRIPADGYSDFDVANDGTMAYFAVESDAATAYWIGYPTSIF